jgi:hypothetical protein
MDGKVMCICDMVEKNIVTGGNWTKLRRMQYKLKSCG